MGEETYLDASKRKLSYEVTFMMRPKGWQELLNTKSQRKSVSSRRNSKDKDSEVKKSLRCLRKWKTAKWLQHGEEFKSYLYLIPKALRRAYSHIFSSLD